MASNPYVNKVALADGRTLIDISGDTVAANKMLSGTTAHDKSGAPVTGTIADYSGATSVTPGRTAQTILCSGKRMLSDIVIAAIPNTYYTAEEAIKLFFPVGSVYTSTSPTAPTFGGTWTEIKVTATWDQLAAGERSYTNGSGNGTLHYWLRTA